MTKLQDISEKRLFGWEICGKIYSHVRFAYMRRYLGRVNVILCNGRFDIGTLAHPIDYIRDEASWIGSSDNTTRSFGETKRRSEQKNFSVMSRSADDNDTEST